jgi:hypothetical protein
MKATAVKSPVLCSGLLMAMVSLGVACLAQSQGPEQQPMGTMQASASEPGSEAAQSGESKPALRAGNSQREADEFTESRLGLSLLKNIALDQKAIWTSPAHLRWADGSWLFPLAAVTAGFFATDRAVPPALSKDPNKLNRYTKLSDYGVYSLIGAGGGLYVWSKISHDDHQRETGLLAGEAAINSFAVDTTFKYAFGRERPNQDQGLGNFFRSGDSFPSDHSAVAWSIASVLAHEYPGPLTKVAVYGLATAVSASRVLGKQHFPSDVVVGGAIGWLIGRQVYRAHHDPDLGGSAWGSLLGEDEEARRQGLPDKSAASTFVPLDSWVYPSFDRLVSMGFAPTALQGMKPWTRIECARLTEEVGDALLEATRDAHDPDEQAVQIQETLKREFSQEIAVLNGARNLSFAVDSVYTRVMSINGPILTDGFNFGGQTISYDFGRPFRRGTNALMGTSVRASEGPFAIFARVEFQHSPSAPPLSDSILQFISMNDSQPLQVAHPLASVNRADLLEGYLSFNHSGWQVSAGKQTMSWGVGEGGSMLLSDNAEPLYMVRLTRVIPVELPGFLQIVGPFRTEWFLAKVNGGSVVPHPLMYGQKFSFSVAHFLEIGFGRTVFLGRGPNAIGGDPFTTLNFLRSLFAINTSFRAGVPGSNQGSLDINLDVPGLNHSVSLYADLYTKDVPIYLADPPTGSYRAGMFLPRLPHASRMDFRFESTSTESPIFATPYRGLLNYYNSGYRDGYTNYGQLMGNTVGRQGRIFQAWSAIHLSAVDQIQFSFKDQQVDPHFVPGGGLWQDYIVSYEMHVRSGFYVKSAMQFEHIQHFPMLFNGRVNNITGSIEIGFVPAWLKL